MRTGILLALVAWAGISRGYPQETSESNGGSKLLALENLWNQAAEGKDLKALNRILDDAFVEVDSEGTLLTKAEVLARVRASEGYRFISESMVVHLHGGTAVVTGIYRATRPEHGKRIVRRERFVDTWLYAGGFWVSIARLTTPAGS